MKEDNMLTIASLFSLLLLTFHLTGDIIYGWEKGGLANLIGVTLIGVIWLYGVLMFRERIPGYIITLLGGLISLFVPYVHMSGKVSASRVGCRVIVDTSFSFGVCSRWA